jgi:hypothetical protein
MYLMTLEEAHLTASKSHGVSQKAESTNNSGTVCFVLKNEQG